MICPICKTECSDTDRRGRPRKVCSRRCALKKGRPKHIPFIIACNFCGRQIRKSPAAVKHSKSGKLYCNKVCKAKKEAKKLQKLIACDLCGVEISRSPSNIKTHNFCSRKCRGLWSRRFTGEMAFAWKGGYNKDERTLVRGRIYWKNLRKEIIEHFSKACAECGIIHPYLHLHHITPVRLGGKDVAENLIPLCPQCHSKQTVKDWELEKGKCWKDSGAHVYKGVV